MKKVINNDEILPVIQNLLSGVIPEQYDEFFKQYGHIKFAFLEDNTGIVFRWNVENKVIEFSSKSLRVVWLFTIAIWKVYSKEAQNCLDTNSVDNNLKMSVADSYNLAIKLLKAPSEDEFEWPKDILHPNDVVLKNKNLNPEEEICFKLACFSLSFILLHEYNHAINNHSSITGCYALDEEFESDKFAIDTLIDRVKNFSEKTGQDLYKLYLLRFLGIFFSLVFLYKHEQLYGNNGETHPLVKKRMELFMNKMLYIKSNDEYIFNDDDKFFSILFLILKSEVNLSDLNLEQNNTAKDIVIELIKHL